VAGLLEFRSGVACDVTGQLFAVVRIRVVEVAIAINPVEMEIAKCHRPNEVLGSHDLVKELPWLRYVQHPGVRLNRAL
jgi:hypothetical protein